MEIIRVVVTDPSGDFRDGQLGVDEQVLGFTHAAQDDVFHRGESDFRTEEMGDVIGVGMDGFCDVGEFYVLFVMSVDILPGHGGGRGFGFFLGRAVTFDELANFGNQSEGEEGGGLCPLWQAAFPLDAAE